MYSKLTTFSLLIAVCAVFLLSVGCSGDKGTISSDPVVKTGTVTDIDGNIYKTVMIGDQWWMAENLKVTRYRNGDEMFHATSSSSWGYANGTYGEYNNNSTYALTYGRLYNWYAITDSRNIAPEGWRVATDSDWKLLEISLGMNQSSADSTGWRGTIAGSIKESGTEHWDAPNTGATNQSGFSALPSGFIEGSYRRLGSETRFWTSTELDNNSAWGRSLHCDSLSIGRVVLYHSGYDGYSVRCVKE